MINASWMTEPSILKKENDPMISNYEAPEILEIGKAHDVIFGSIKDPPIFDESPIQELGRNPMQDDE